MARVPRMSPLEILAKGPCREQVEAAGERNQSFNFSILLVAGPIYGKHSPWNPNLAASTAHGRIQAAMGGEGTCLISKFC